MTIVKSLRTIYYLFFLTAVIEAQDITWEKISFPMYNQNFVVFADSTNKINLFEFSNPIKFYQSSDNGTAWTFLYTIPHLLVTGNEFGSNLACFNKSNQFFTRMNGDAYRSGPYFVRSNDYGRSWDTLITGNYGFEIFSLGVQPVTNKLYLNCIDVFSSSYMVYRSSDNGDSWTFINDVGFRNPQKWVFANNGFIFVFEFGYLWRSMDDGESWELIIQQEPPIQIDDLEINSSDELFLTLREKGLLSSSDYGNTWSLLNFPQKDPYKILIGKNNYLFVVTENSNIFLSNDDAQTWKNITSNYDGARISNLLESVDGYLFLKSDSTLYRSSKLLTEVNNSYNQPESYFLLQNYPNPFNSISNIKYQITNTENINLTVYDVLGSKVITLVNKEQSPGSYNATFNSDNLPSGVYFYTLQTGGFSQTKKMVILR